ncbi:MAG: acetamidase/formamidase [Firmicutes bacterium]|nr:acetamidase/formamidase [Bacillota bacterium]
MKVIRRDRLIYSMGPGHKPVLYIDPGETILVETEDCFGHQVVSSGYSLDDGFNHDYLNPATGTIFINGVEPGDVLKVYIDKISLNSRGVVVAYRGWGPLGNRIEGTHVRVVEVSENHALINGRKIPLNPMIGVIGVAPAEGSVPNSTPGPHGGNLDTKEITEGAILYLPVFMRGAHLALGDLHAAMGDGEVCGTGVEIRGAVRMQVSIANNYTFKSPVIESKDAFFFLGSSPDIEAAVKIATDSAVRYISEQNNISWIDGYILASLRCNLMFSQIVNPWKTVKMRVEKELLHL